MEIVEQRWPDGKLRLRRHVLRKPDGTLVDHGTYTRWYDNGRKEYEATFVRGRKEGSATGWHKNGRKWTQQRYVNGKRHGDGRVWDESGVEREVEIIEEHWPDGKLRLRRRVVRDSDGTLVDHGTYTRWHDSGQKEYAATFVQGRKDGTTTSWHKNGQKWTQQQYLYGDRDGISYIWDNTGVKRKEECHANGKPHGTWTQWSSDGRVKWQGSYEHGVPAP